MAGGVDAPDFCDVRNERTGWRSPGIARETRPLSDAMAMTAARELSARQPALKGTGEPDAVFRGTEATMRRMLSKNWVGRLAHVIAPIGVALVVTAGVASDDVRAAVKRVGRIEDHPIYEE